THSLTSEFQGGFCVTMMATHGPDITTAGTVKEGYPSAFALPAPMLVGLPVRHLKSLRLGSRPALARRDDGVRIIAVEQQDQAIVGCCVPRQRNAINQKANSRPVRVVVADREQHRLFSCCCFAIRSVRQEAVVAEGPQMRVERVNPLFG